MKQKTLFFLYLLILILPNLILCVTETIPTIGKITLVVLPLACYWVMMTISRNVNKSYLWMFPFLFLGAFNIVLSYLFGRGVIAVDMWLTLASTNPSEAGEMLSQIYPSVIFVIVVYLPTLSYAVWRLKKDRPMPLPFLRRQRRNAAILSVAAVITLSASLFNPRFVFLDDIFPVNVCYNFKLALNRYAHAKGYEMTSRDFRFNAVSTDADSIPEVIVLVIGETSRACNWQLGGYERPTNPELSKMKDLIFYKDCMSQSNTTHKSVPILLSLATAEDYDILYTTHGIFEAYREAGFKTAFLSNEGRNGSFIDHLGEESGNALFIRDDDKLNPSDNRLLPLVEQRLHENPGRLLLIVHTYGSHSTYSERYSREDAYFQPDVTKHSNKENRELLLNAYDNTIRFTDRWLAKMIGILRATERPAALLYISDHGEDLFDDNRNLFMHASPHPSYYQLHVPLVAWASPQYEALHPQRVSLMRKRHDLPVQSDCIFPTLLTLGGIQTAYGQQHLSIAAPEFEVKAERHYLTDHNVAAPLNIALRPLDLKAMEERGLTPH